MSKKTWNLLSCPFCGGRPELKVFPYPSDKSRSKVEIKCTNCLAQGRTFMDGERMTGGKVEVSEAVEAAVFLWNRREDNQVSTQRRKALNNAFSLISKAKDILEDVRDDGQEMFNILTASLWSMELGEEMEIYIRELDEAYKYLDDAGSIIKQI